MIDLLVFSPDGSELAIGACDLPLYLVGEMDTICDGRRLWTVDAATGEMLHRFGEFHFRIASLVWSPDGTRLYSDVEFYKKFDFVDNAILSSIRRRASAWGSSSRRWATAPSSRSLCRPTDDTCCSIWPPTAGPLVVQWWDVTDASRPRSIHQEVPARYHRLSPDGTRVLTVNTKDNTLRLFNIETGEAVTGFPAVAREFYLRGSGDLDSDRCGWKSTDTRQLLDFVNGKIQPAPEPGVTKTNRYVFADVGRS